MVYGSLLTDPSKAFDSLPHGVLIAKLQAYGVCKASCMLILNYLSLNYYELGVTMFTYSIYRRTQLHNINFITCSRAEI